VNDYPITQVDLARTSCMVIVGQEVAARRLASLRAPGACPVVTSPASCAADERQAEGQLEAIHMCFLTGTTSDGRIAEVLGNSSAALFRSSLPSSGSI
jgi:hypothetical protein